MHLLLRMLQIGTGWILLLHGTAVVYMYYISWLAQFPIKYIKHDNSTTFLSAIKIDYHGNLVVNLF